MPVPCPHCQNLIEASTTAVEVVCQSCGASFRVESEATSEWHPSREGRKVGKFELIDRLGIGAFGTVYKARDPELDRVVAVKVPRGGILAEPEDLDRFVREARSVAQLRHAAIVSVYEVGQAAQVPYLVCEYVEGITLSDLLSARRPTPAEAAALIATVADALHYAHEQGVIHRDLKPANIMLDPQGAPRVMDFGLAKRDTGDVTMTVHGQVLGTPAYMSPEQARGESHQVDGRTDVYSLGVILYQLLTGEPPFRGTPRMLQHQVLNEEPRPPRRLNDRLPRDLETICLKAMAKEPGRRYASARDLADDLRRFARGEAIQARPLGAFERARRWIKRRPAMAALLAVSAGSLLTFLVLVLVLWRSAAREAAALQEKAGLAQDLEDTRRQVDAAKKDLLSTVRDLGEARGKLNEASKDLTALSDRLAEIEGRLALEHAKIKLAKAATEKAVEELRQVQYPRDLALAQKAWEMGSQKDAQRLLLAHKDAKDLHGFEWHYYTRLIDAEQVLASRKPAAGPLSQLTFSGDGTLLAALTAEADYVQIWDVRTRKDRGAFPVPAGLKLDFQLGFTADGKNLALIHMSDAEKLASCRKEAAAMIKGEKRISLRPLLDALEMHVLDLEKGAWGRGAYEPKRVSAPVDLSESLLAIPAHGQVFTITHLWPSPDGKQAALGGFSDRDGTKLGALLLWDLAADKPGPLLSVSDGAPRIVAFAPDGNTLAMGTGPWASSPGHRLTLWDLTSGKERWRQTIAFGFAALASPLAFSEDGQTLALAFRGVIRHWDVATGHNRPSFRFITASGLDQGTLSSNGRFGAFANASGAVEVWDLETAQGPLSRLFFLSERATGPVGETFNHLRLLGFAPDGKTLLGLDRLGKLHRWQMPKAGPYARLSRPGKGPAFGEWSADGSLFAERMKQVVKVWHTDPGKERYQLLEPQGGNFVGLKFSAKGDLLATTSVLKTGEPKVHLWSLATGTPMRQQDLSVVAAHLCFSPDGSVLAVGGHCHLHLWNIKDDTLRSIPVVADGQVHPMAFSGDGKLLATTDHKTVTLWNVDSGKPRRSIEGLGGRFATLALSPDGKRLATVGGELAPNGGVRLFDTTSGMEVLIFDADLSFVAVAFSPDGRRLAAATASRDASDDGGAPRERRSIAEIRIWDATAEAP